MNTRSKSKARKNSNSSEDLETDDAVTLGSILNQLEDTENPFEGYPSIENKISTIQLKTSSRPKNTKQRFITLKAP